MFGIHWFGRLRFLDTPPSTHKATLCKTVNPVYCTRAGEPNRRRRQPSRDSVIERDTDLAHFANYVSDKRTLPPRSSEGGFWRCIRPEAYA